MVGVEEPAHGSTGVLCRAVAVPVLALCFSHFKIISICVNGGCTSNSTPGQLLGATLSSSTKWILEFELSPQATLFASL